MLETMIFKDIKGRKFKWKVRCLSIPIEDELEKCIHCNGTGIQNDVNSFNINECTYCINGMRKVQINCFNNDLEKYLEEQIEKYYERAKP